ncbi:hypothetical protein D9M73_75010 [compost metagenome]
MAIELFDACVDDLDGRHDIVGSLQHIKDADIGPLQPLAKDKSELDFDARRNETFERNIAAFRKKHVIKQRAVVRFVDLAGLLHGARGQAYLVTTHDTALVPFHLDPGAGNRVAVLNRHAGKAL